MKEKIILRYCSQSDRGLRRPDNQDAYGKFPAEQGDTAVPGGQLFIVADGMGGHARGAEASRIAVTKIGEVYFHNPESDPVERLQAAYRQANQEIYQHSLGHSANPRTMGTTSTALAFVGERLYIAHVGDSKVFRIYDHAIEQLTRDHTKVAELHRRGILSSQEVRNHPEKSVLIRALGVKPEMEVDVMRDIALRNREIYVLCSDGLMLLDPEEIKRVVMEHPLSEVCAELIRMGNQRGGVDNITVQIIEVHFERTTASLKREPLEVQTQRKRSAVPLLWWGIGLVFTIMVLVSAIFFYTPTTREQPSGSAVPAIENPPERSRQPEDSGLPTPLAQANSLFNAGNIDSAAVLYRHILENNPFHMEALAGIERIAEAYLREGERFRRRGAYNTALGWFQKAAQLKPGDSAIRSRIEELQAMTRH